MSELTQDVTAADLATYALRLGDDALILGQRLGEWVGHAPALELEMAIANMGLDLIGEGKLYLTLAGEMEGQGRDADALAFTRDVLDFTNLLIVERPNGDWADSIVRHYLFSVAHRLRHERLADSAEPRLAEIAQKTLPEIAYHIRFSRDWMLRLGGGTDESHARLQAAVNRIWRFTGEMVQSDALEDRLAAAGVAPCGADFAADWRAEVTAVCDQAGVTIPEVKQMLAGGRDGRHSEHLGHLLAELQFMQRAYPGLEW